jgi:hypothetical protein
MTSSTDWAARPVPAALSVERLASLVDRALDRHAGLLFTATPREELDEIGRFQQLKDLAWAGQVRAIVAAWNRASESEREFAGDEVALAVGAAPGTGSRLVEVALQAAALPGLLEAVEGGLLTERHVNVVLRELHAVALTLEQRQAVVLVLLARYTGQAPAELGRLAARLILTVDRAAALARQEQASRERRVRCYPDVDGQAVLHARGPLAQIAAIKAALAAALPDQAEGDERSRDAREFDLLVALLTGTTEATSGWHAHVVVPFTTAQGGELELAEVPGFGPVLPSTAQDLLDGCVDLTQVAVDENGTVIAVSDPIPVEHPVEPQPVEHDPTEQEPVEQEPADPQPVAPEPGQPAPVAPEPVQPEPVAPAPTHRDPIVEALKRMAEAPGSRPSGVVGYRVPRRVRRFLEARDRTCVFPGCHQPAQATDKDHRVPWPLGATHPDNLQCLCRRHHRAKQVLFTVELTPEEHYRWTTRGGWQFLRRQRGY